MFIVLTTIVSISAISAADNTSDIVSSDCGDSVVSDVESPSQASSGDICKESSSTDAIPTTSEDTDNTEKSTIGPEQGKVGGKPTITTITSTNTSKVGTDELLKLRYHLVMDQCLVEEM